MHVSKGIGRRWGDSYEMSKLWGYRFEKEPVLCMLRI